MDVTDSRTKDEIASIRNALPAEITPVFRKQPPPSYLRRLSGNLLRTQYSQPPYLSVMAAPKLPLMRPPAIPPPIVWPHKYKMALGNSMSPVVMVAKVMVGLTWPPEVGALAYMKRDKRKMFVTPTYAGSWDVCRFVRVVSIRADM